MDRHGDGALTRVAVRPGTPHDHDLWRDYCAFYEVEISEEVSARTWERLHDPGSPPGLLIATADGGEIVGFAHYLPHPSTWRRGESCYLEDLFVRPEARGAGVARALIDTLIELCRERGWARLYWHTQRDNQPARRLYDRYGRADDFVRYVLELGD